MVSSNFSRILFASFALFALLGGSAHAGKSKAGDAEKVQAIYAVLDDRSASPEEKLTVFAADGVLLPPDQLEVRGSEQILQHLRNDQTSGVIETTHEYVELTSFKEIVVAQGRAFGTWSQPGGDGTIVNWETKNLIVFKRQKDGSLIIWKVIWNPAPQG